MMGGLPRWLRRACVAAAVGATGILAGSGLWLATRSPRSLDPEDEHYELLREHHAPGGAWIHELHVWSGIVLLALAIMTVVAMIVGALRRPSVRTGRAVGAGALVVLLLAVGVASGGGLRWLFVDGLAPAPVPYDPDHRLDPLQLHLPQAGVWDVAHQSGFDRLVTSDGVVATSKYSAKANGHLLAVPAALLVALAIAAEAADPRLRRLRRRAANAPHVLSGAAAGALVLLAWMLLVPWDFAPVVSGAVTPHEQTMDGQTGASLAVPIGGIALAVVVVGVVRSRRQRAVARSWTWVGLMVWTVLFTSRLVGARGEQSGLAPGGPSYLTPLLVFALPALLVGPWLVGRAGRPVDVRDAGP